MTDLPLQWLNLMLSGLRTTVFVVALLAMMGGFLGALAESMAVGQGLWDHTPVAGHAIAAVTWASCFALSIPILLAVGSSV